MIKRWEGYDVDYHTKLIEKYENVEKIFIGIDIKDHIPNTVLLHLGSGKYVLIKDAIDEFNITNDKIINTVSALDIDHLPEPILIGEKYVYKPPFYAERKYFPSNIYDVEYLFNNNSIPEDKIFKLDVYTDSGEPFNRWLKYR